VEDDDLEKLCDAIQKLNKRVSDLDQRNVDIESLIASLAPVQGKQNVDNIVDQECTIADPLNLNGYKSISMPNGGVVKLKSKSFCINGRHLVVNADDIIFCSKCNTIMCKQHDHGLDEPVCTNCLKEEIKDFDDVSLYILFSLRNGISIRRLKARINVPQEKFKEAIEKLFSYSSISQDIFLRYHITIYGEQVLDTAARLYDFSFLEPLKSK
jgi:hypothetical protein